MILVQFPEFTINDIKVLVTEEIGYLVDVVLLLQNSQGSEQIRPAKLTERYETTPRTVDNEENSSYHSMNVSGMEFCGFFEES